MSDDTQERPLIRIFNAVTTPHFTDVSLGIAWTPATTRSPIPRFENNETPCERYHTVFLLTGLDGEAELPTIDQTETIQAVLSLFLYGNVTRVVADYADWLYGLLHAVPIRYARVPKTLVSMMSPNLRRDVLRFFRRESFDVECVSTTLTILCRSCCYTAKTTVGHTNDICIIVAGGGQAAANQLKELRLGGFPVSVYAAPGTGGLAARLLERQVTNNKGTDAELLPWPARATQYCCKPAGTLKSAVVTPVLLTPHLQFYPVSLP